MLRSLYSWIIAPNGTVMVCAPIGISHMKYPWVHFLLLLLGSVYFLNSLTETAVASGSGDRLLLEIWAIKRMLTIAAYYMVFATLVMAHGVSRRSLESNPDVEPSVDARNDT